MGEAAVRFYREGEADDQLLEVLERAFGRWPWTEITVPPLEHLRWKLSTPGASGTHIVAEADGGIVGCRLSVFREMEVGGRTLRYRNGTDSCVHPAWQRRGVMAAMRAFGWAALRERFDLHGGSTNNQRIIDLDLRDGRRLFANAIEVLERDTDGIAHETAIDVRVAEAFDARADVLWGDARGEFDLAVVRSSGYLTWRYADPRGGRYTILLAEQGQTLLGFAVLALSQGRGCVADVLVAPGRLDALAALLVAGTARLREEGASRVQCWCPRRHPYRETLERCGFRRRRAMRGVTLGPYDPAIDLSMMEDPELRLHYTPGDTDLA